MKFRIILLILIPFFIQCKQEVTTEKQSIKNELITDAEGISIAKYSNFSIADFLSFMNCLSFQYLF